MTPMTMMKTQKHKREKNYKLIAIALLVTLFASCSVIKFNTDKSVRLASDTIQSIEEITRDLRDLSIDLDKCYYTGEFNQSLDRQCLKTLSEMTRKIDTIPESQNYALIWSGTHTYLDLKFYQAYKQPNIVERIHFKSVMEQEIRPNQVEIDNLLITLLAALKANYKERLSQSINEI